MALVRRVRIEHFRGIRYLQWHPGSGMNCLVGPGDSGKSTVLTAISWCLSGRRSLRPHDGDFHDLDVGSPIRITVVLGELEDALQELRRYGDYLRGWDADREHLEDEPGASLETALELELTIDASLDPVWSLRSDRVGPDAAPRPLAWSDHQRLAPLEIGSRAEEHLRFGRNSVLGRLGPDGAESGASLAAAARAARATFEIEDGGTVQETLGAVRTAADSVGFPDAQGITATLDARSITLSGGALSLHGAGDVPLSSYGLGSKRLLIAALQRQAMGGDSTVLADEIEQGLEPHRIARLLRALGAKDEAGPQVFATTHSPNVIRELSAGQLHVIRSGSDTHDVRSARSVQGTLRSHPEAFLGRRVLVCEGATEVGFVRGLDRFAHEWEGASDLAMEGTVVVDAGGVNKIYALAKPLVKLGYEVAVLRDDDVQPDPAHEAHFEAAGGIVLKWEPGQSIEAAVFHGVSEQTMRRLCRFAIELHGAERVHEHVRTAVGGKVSELDAWLDEDADFERRSVLAKAAGTGSWFKRIDRMEEATLTIVCPSWERWEGEFASTCYALLDWTRLLPTKADQDDGP